MENISKDIFELIKYNIFKIKRKSIAKNIYRKKIIKVKDLNLIII
jgi:hypothetical protein